MIDYQKIKDTHIELVEAVNNAEEGLAKSRAEAKLEGFRKCAEIIYGDGFGNFLSLADWHYLSQGIDRPMCCGVWLTDEEETDE